MSVGRKMHEENLSPKKQLKQVIQYKLRDYYNPSRHMRKLIRLVYSMLSFTPADRPSMMEVMTAVAKGHHDTRNGNCITFSLYHTKSTYNKLLY